MGKWKYPVRRVICEFKSLPPGVWESEPERQPQVRPPAARRGKKFASPAARPANPARLPGM